MSSKAMVGGRAMVSRPLLALAGTEFLGLLAFLPNPRLPIAPFYSAAIEFLSP